jgi:hypothetical protein
MYISKTISRKEHEEPISSRAIVSPEYEFRLGLHVGIVRDMKLINVKVLAVSHVKRGT